MEETKKKEWYKRWYMIVVYCFVGLMIIGAFLPNDSSNKTIYICSDGSQVYDSSQCSPVSAQTQDNTQNIVTPPVNEPNPTGAVIEEVTPAPNLAPTPTVEENSNKATMGEKNALSKALSYLNIMAFSYSGLIKQLEYEGYTHQEAVYAVDNCEADWNKQAALKAQSYLDIMAFSKDGLIEQLVYEGFTREQAEYGVQAVGY
jgi:hypothetical protein